MNAYEKIRAALNLAEHAAKHYGLAGLGQETTCALAALAELEKVASPQFVAGEVDDAMCERIYMRYLETQEPGCKPVRQIARVWLEAWRSELGPALGMVEIREPTPEECERICTEYERLLMRECTCGGRECTCGGRDAFDAVRNVMWPKEGL